jgi:hypothetical protein
MTQAMMAWGTRAQQYNALRAIVGRLFEQHGALHRQVQDARDHCLGQTSKLREAEEESREAQKLLTEANRTSLIKDDILKHLDHAAFNIAASRAIFEHTAHDMVPPSTIMRFSDGREEVFHHDGTRQQERLVAGIEEVKTLLDAAATYVLSLGAPLTGERRTPFSFPARRN